MVGYLLSSLNYPYVQGIERGALGPPRRGGARAGKRMQPWHVKYYLNETPPTRTCTSVRGHVRQQPNVVTWQ